MEGNQTTTGKLALKYGLILGLLGIVFNLMLYSQDLHYQIDLTRLLVNVGIGLAFVLGGSIFAMKEFKKANDGFMSFGQGLKIGVGLSLISGIIATIFGFILAEVIDPEMQEKAITFAVESMRDAGMTEEQIDQRMEGQREPNYPLQIGVGLIFSIVLGFIGSLIPALVLKKQEDDY